MRKKNISKKIYLAAIFFFFAGSVHASSWADFGGAKTKNGLASFERANETNIAVSDSGKIFVAYQNRRDRVFVREFNGSKWIDLAGESGNSYLARDGRNPTLALKGEELYVGYTDLGAGKKARVRKWDGALWQDLADASHTLGYISDLEGFEPALCFDKPRENLYVAFRDEASGLRIKVMKWNDDVGWQTAADANNPDGLVSSFVASEVDVKASKQNDDMYVAFEDLANDGRIRAKKWDGANWSDLADASHPGGIISSIAGYSPSIDLDAAGNLYLVYTGKNNKNTYIHKWDGSNWNDIGGGLAVRGKTIESTIAVDERGYVYLAYSQKTRGAWRVRARVWNGNAWFDTRDRKSQNISKGKGKGDSSLAAFGNTIHMSFTDARNKSKARVKTLNFEP